MAIDLNKDYISYRELGDRVNFETFVGQTGTVYKELYSGARRREFRVFMPKQTGDNADLIEWREFLKGSISHDGSTWVVIEDPPFTLEYIDDIPYISVLRFILTEVNAIY